MLPSFPFVPAPRVRLLAARLRALSAARLAVTLLLGSSSGDAALLAARPWEGPVAPAAAQRDPR